MHVGPEGETVNLDVHFRTGGKLKLHTDLEAGAAGGNARYRLFDAQGIPLRLDYGYELPLHLGETHEVPRRLAPGSYELVLIVDRAGRETVSSFPLEIHAGETSLVEID